MGSNVALMAEMQAFWLEYDALQTGQQKHDLMVMWHCAHGGFLANRQHVANGRASLVGELVPGIHPVRLSELTP